MSTVCSVGVCATGNHAPEQPGQIDEPGHPGGRPRLAGVRNYQSVPGPEAFARTRSASDHFARRTGLVLRQSGFRFPVRSSTGARTSPAPAQLAFTAARRTGVLRPGRCRGAPCRPSRYRRPSAASPPTSSTPADGPACLVRVGHRHPSAGIIRSGPHTLSVGHGAVRNCLLAATTATWFRPPSSGWARRSPGTGLSCGAGLKHLDHLRADRTRTACASPVGATADDRQVHRFATRNCLTRHFPLSRWRAGPVQTGTIRSAFPGLDDLGACRRRWRYLKDAGYQRSGTHRPASQGSQIFDYWRDPDGRYWWNTSPRRRPDRQHPSNQAGRRFTATPVTGAVGSAGHRQAFFRLQPPTLLTQRN